MTLFPRLVEPGETDLGAEEGVLAYGRTVTHLDEIVDFGTGANPGLTDRSPVDAGICLDFDGVLEDRGSGLKDFVPAAAERLLGVLGEPEAVGADDGAVLEDYTIAKLAVFADDGVGVRKEVVAYADIGIDDDVSEENGAIAKDGAIHDHDEGPDVSAGADSRSGGDNGGGVDPRRVQRRAVEDLDRPGEGEVRVGCAKGGGRKLGKGRFYEDSRGLCRARERGISGIGDEGELARAGGLDTGDGMDKEIGVAAPELGIERVCEVLE